VFALDKLLAALDSANVRCTFFLTGRWASQHPDLAKEIHSRGHEIGNHSWSHPDLTLLDTDRIRSEVSRTDAFLTGITGQSPRPYFRAPFGARNLRVLSILADLGYNSIYWTLDSLDSVNPKKARNF
jgi:peptidoglycan/xylan/chitin deacetylase (PgdA/CDA1 family)